MNKKTGLGLAMMAGLMMAGGKGLGGPSFQGTMPTERVEQADGSYVCRTCGCTFRSPVKNAKFCGPDCYGIHRAKTKFRMNKQRLREYVINRFGMTPAELGRRA